PLPIGPFNLVGAARQAGSILIANSAPDVRTQFHPRGDLERRELSEDEQRADPTLIAAFNYRNVGAGDRNGGSGGASQPWIDLDVENVRGLIETRVAHTLRLQRVAADRLVWRLATTLDCKPIR